LIGPPWRSVGRSTRSSSWRSSSTWRLVKGGLGRRSHALQLSGPCVIGNRQRVAAALLNDRVGGPPIRVYSGKFGSKNWPTFPKLLIGLQHVSPVGTASFHQPDARRSIPQARGSSLGCPGSSLLSSRSTGPTGKARRASSIRIAARSRLEPNPTGMIASMFAVIEPTIVCSQRSPSQTRPECQSGRLTIVV
jgi:hypothetical protein